MHYVPTIQKLKTLIEPHLNIKTKAMLDDSLDYWIGSHEGTILIGYMFSNGRIRPLYILINNLYGYHTVIVGTTRSGKTTCAKTLLYLLITSLPHVHFTIFDIENEFFDFTIYPNVTVYNLLRVLLLERYSIIFTELQRINAKSNTKNEKKEILVFDELQRIAPESNESNQGLNREEIDLRWLVYREYIQFLQQGLKRNTSSLNISPTIAGVTKATFDECRNKIIFRVEPREIEQHISKLTHSLTRSQMKKLTELERGQCAIIGEITGGFKPVFCKIRQFDQLKTYSMV